MRPESLRGDARLTLAKHVLLHLAGGGRGQLINKTVGLRGFEMRQLRPHVLFELTFALTRPGFQNDEGMRAFSPFFVRHSNDCGLLNSRMCQQAPFQLDRRNVLASADNDVLETVPNLNIAIRMYDGCIS